MQRRTARRFIALTAGTILTSPLLCVPAHATTSDYTLRALKFTVQVDGDSYASCAVDADLYTPDGASSAAPLPAILTTNGFGGSKNDSGTASMAQDLAERGYIVLAYSGLGFGKSTCPISVDSPGTDGRAAGQLIDFLAGTRAADDGTRLDDVQLDAPGDPRVGMIGGSYGGAVQLATASIDHRLDAIVPMITWNDLAYALDPNSTDQQHGVTSGVPGVYKSQWSNGFFLAGQLAGLTNLNPDVLKSPAGCINFTADICSGKALLDSGSYPADPTAKTLATLRGDSPVSYLGEVTTPTLLIQGEADTLFDLNQAVATYQTLRTQGTAVKMIWQASGHSGGTTAPEDGELNIQDNNFETSYEGRRILDWFDHYLRHEPDTDTGPAFAYYRDWMPADDRYGTADAFPAATREETLYLSGGADLVSAPDDVTSGRQSYTNLPVPTSHSGGLLDSSLGVLAVPAFDTPGTYAGYTSAALTGNVDVAGIPRVALRLTSPAAQAAQGTDNAAGDLVLFAKIYDVAPDGSRTLTNRLVAPVRVPDVTKAFTVALPAIVHRFPAGHRIRLVIAASDDAYYGNQGIKPVTITTGRGTPDVLTLPTVG